MSEPTEEATAVNAIIAIAKAVEANAVALMGASNAVQDLVEAWREHAAADPFAGVTKQ